LLLVLLLTQYFVDLKVLILAYDFPPLISIGGQRPYSWYKYLPQSDINVTVVTRHWSGKISSPSDYVQQTEQEVKTETDSSGVNTVIRVPFAPNLRDKILLQFGFEKFVGLRKLLTYLYAYLEHLFFFFDSKSAIYWAAKKAIERNKPDLIIATGEPFILFRYGHYLSSEYSIPWIVDYRDGWTSNQGNYESGSLKSALDNFYRRREKLYAGNASLITTASPTYAETLHKIHPDKEIKVVYNGFDEEFFQGLDKIVPPSEKFIISYAGTIYPHQNLEMFLDGLLDFVKAENLTQGEMEVLFYGLDSQPLARQRLFAFHPELNDFLKSEPRTEYSELIKKLRSSHLLLLLSKKEANWLNAKIFDYMAVKRPIMLVENDEGILGKILKEMNAGKALNSSNEVVAFLQTSYAGFKRNDLPDTNLNPEYLKYSRKQQALELAGILKSLSANG
jgi:glycosyltransferase involved in cell wall biosynthesis